MIAKHVKRPALAALALVALFALGACGPGTSTPTQLAQETGLPSVGTPAMGTPSAEDTTPAAGTPGGDSLTPATAGTAATAPPAGVATQPPATAEEGQPLAAKVEGLVNLQVETADGQTAGVVRDLLIDLETGGIAYLVIARESSTMAGSPIAVGLVAVPWTIVQHIRAEDMVVVLTADSVTFQGAPDLPLEELPELITDPNWDSALRNYWSGLAAALAR